jgi:poly(glycerol-phosphate) alpha-glucosyltransferase
MKILILGGVSSRSGGGVFHVMHRQGHALQQLPGTEVHFLLYDDEHSAADRVHFARTQVHTYSITGPANLAYSPDVYQRIEEIAPDVVHVHGMWLYLAHANRKYHQATGTPYVISPHGMLDSWQLRQSWWKNTTKKIAFQLYEGEHLQRAAAIHALNEAERDAIRDFGLENPIAIIPNATKLPGAPSPDEQAAQWVIDDRKVLLFLSRIHTKKGLDNLLRGWAASQPAEHGWRLVIAGDTTDTAYWDQLRSLQRELGITDSSTFVGGQFGEEKARSFRAADGFILPSFSEGLPMAVLEAWSYRLPVLMTTYCNLDVGFRAGAAREIDTSADSIATGIRELIRMPEPKRREMGERGYELVRRQYTWDTVARDTLDLYRWALGRGSFTNLS